MRPIVAARPATRTIARDARSPTGTRSPPRAACWSTGRTCSTRCPRPRPPRRPPRSSAGCVASIPAAIDHRARLRRAARTRPAQRADRVRGRRPLQRRADRGRRDPHHDRGRPADRRRGRHGDPPGRHRRPRPAPWRATPRRPDGGVRVAARPARQRAAGLAVDRQPATGAVRTAIGFRACAVRLARTLERRRPGRDGPPGWKRGRGATTKKGNPKKAPEGGWDW